VEWFLTRDALESGLPTGPGPERRGEVALNAQPIVCRSAGGDSHHGSRVALVERSDELASGAIGAIAGDKKRGPAHERSDRKDDQDNCPDTARLLHRPPGWVMIRGLNRLIPHQPFPCREI
jgi:hypothetical protein